MNQRLGRIFSGLTIVLCLTGCMTIRSGSTSQRVSIVSTPPGASVRIQPSGQELTTPAEVALERKRSHTIVVSHPGYQPAQFLVESQLLEETFWRNLVWLNPVGIGVGIVVDISNGSAYALTPDSLAVELERVPVPSEEP